MASFIPAACNPWAMDHAIERLLATPKTTAVRPCKSEDMVAPSDWKAYQPEALIDHEPAFAMSKKSPPLRQGAQRRSCDLTWRRFLPRHALLPATSSLRTTSHKHTTGSRMRPPDLLGAPLHPRCWRARFA